MIKFLKRTMTILAVCLQTFGAQKLPGRKSSCMSPSSVHCTKKCTIESTEPHLCKQHFSTEISYLLFMGKGTKSYGTL